VKKEVRIEVETSKKVWGYVAGEGEFENRDKRPRGPPKRSQKVCGQVRIDIDFDRLSSGGSIIIRSLNAMKKGVKKEDETSEKYGIRSGRRGIRK